MSNQPSPGELPDLSQLQELDVWINCPHCKHGAQGMSAGHVIICFTCDGHGFMITSYPLRSKR